MLYLPHRLVSRISEPSGCPHNATDRPRLKGLIRNYGGQETLNKSLFLRGVALGAYPSIPMDDKICPGRHTTNYHQNHQQIQSLSESSTEVSNEKNHGCLGYIGDYTTQI